MDLKKTGCDSVDWMYLARDKVQCRAVMNTEINLRVP
jgi:hypothetical protein